MRRHWFPFVTLLVLAAALSFAQPAAAPTSAPAAEAKEPDPTIAVHPGQRQRSKPATAMSPTSGPSADVLSVTDHEIKIGETLLKYKATAGTILMKDEADKAKASFFFVAYERVTEPATPVEKRPITYVFNGGPGAASVWLHLGAVGPKRISLSAEGLPPTPPFSIIDNDQTWLSETDLVFIDPVGTGFSRPAPGEKAEQFYGVQEDIASVADFIRVYTTRYQRWGSPKFLAGESYGTTRAALLSENLLDRYGISLNGIILVSSVLNFQTIQPSEANDVPYPLFLPSYTAAAWYHKKLAAELQADFNKTLAESQSFALNEYAAALSKGAALDAEARKGIVQKLSRLTSLTPDFIDKSNLRIDPSSFEKTLLADERKIVGRFDARITGYALDPLSKYPDYDPSLSIYLAPYSSTFNDYARRTLKYESDLPYEVLSSRVQPWNYGRSGGGYLYVADNLRSAMAKSPHLRVMFASGYFDLATPYLSTDYTISHMDLPEELRGHITHTYYQGGHMMYHSLPMLQKLKVDVAKFIGSALAK